MRSLIVSAAVDPNGEAMRYKAAAERHGGVAIRAVTGSSHTFKRMPIDIYYAGNGGAIERLWADADVIHMNNRAAPHERFDAGQAKPTILHHHGTAFRVDPESGLKLARRAGWLTAASTLDLVEIAPEAITWLPTPYDLDALAALRAEHRRAEDGLVRVAHAPTFKTIKGTAAILAAVGALQDEGLPLELDLIEGVSWTECLRRKAAADIFVDQLVLGFGCNAIEAWGMGLPVIAGIDPVRAEAVNHPIPASTRARMLREFGTLPYLEATEATIADALRTLVTSADARAEWALRGIEHVTQFHADRSALERLLELYGRAIGPAAAVA
jgi:glycosyltransferase involved in cell wall biosynthesis